MPRLLDPASSLPSELSLALLAEAAARDTVTARRAALLASLWRAGRWSADGLMARTEAIVGRGCFGRARLAAFRRDMRALKAVLTAADFKLKFSRRPAHGGYYIEGRPDLDPELARLIRSALSDLDPRQLAIASRLSPAQRVWQAGQLSDQLRRMAIRRLVLEQPGLSPREAQREVLHRYYQLSR